MTATKVLIIPAAGSGRRMRHETPKPYIELGDRTILERTISAFLHLDSLRQVLVATSAGFMDVTRQILKSILPGNVTGKVVAGGNERQHSIHNALRAADDADLILVHDAVRPFVKLRHIEACCQAAAEVGAALLGIPSKDTLKRLDDRHFVSETPSRSSMWQAQTPQVFKRELLLEAYEHADKQQFTGTDDASLVEHLGRPVKMIEGERMNIKLTYPMDLELAKLIIQKTKD